jgi:hypothetical protein
MKYMGNDIKIIVNRMKKIGIMSVGEDEIVSQDMRIETSKWKAP